MSVVTIRAVTGGEGVDPLEILAEGGASGPETAAAPARDVTGAELDLVVVQESEVVVGQRASEHGGHAP